MTTPGNVVSRIRPYRYGIYGPAVVRVPNGTLINIPEGYVTAQHGDGYNMSGKKGPTIKMMLDHPYKKVESLQKRGRPRMGKTHKRSSEGRKRHHKRYNESLKARKGRCTKYNFTGAKLLHNVLDVGEVPRYFNRLAYHRERYHKSGKTWVEPKRAPNGFRLLGSPRYSLPMVVVDALMRIYNRIELVPKKGKPTKRTPRRRSTSQTIDRLKDLLDTNPMVDSSINHKLVKKKLDSELEVQKERLARIARFKELDGSFVLDYPGGRALQPDKSKRKFDLDFI